MIENLIKKPIISEKSFKLAGQGVYLFFVAPNANKKTIASEIKEIFKVKVRGVNIINSKGKVKRVGKNIGRRKDQKKALVRLMPGEKITLFEEESGKKKEKKVETNKENK